MENEKQNIYSWEEVIKLLKQWRKMYSTNWNWIDKQWMSIAVQFPDENSFMTEPYMYMEIVRKDKPVIRVPRFPSRLDTFSDTWVEII